jgi:uncharacterized repeat protein (TIGR02543 family)
LTVNIVGNGSVDIDITGPYHYGDIVELTAVPDTGWTFSAWSSDLTGSTNPANITIDGDMSVTATFTQVITGGSIGGVGGSPGITNLTGYMNDGGEFLVDASAESDDGLVKITFPQGTIFLTSNGQPGHFIFIKKQDTPPAPPDNAAFICFTYDISPNGSTFTPYAYLTFFYNDSMVPEGVAEENLVIVTWQDGEWVPLEGCVVDTVNNTITVPLTHLTMFTVIAHTSPASFVASEMTITPAEVHPGEDITVNVTISNIGDLADNYQAVLKVSGMSDRVKTVTLNGGESQTVSFTVTPAGAGSYTVQIGGLTGGFTVKEPEGTVAEVPTPEVPKPSSTPTETEPAIPNPVTPTPAETPETPGETQTTQSGGLSWQFITVYAAGAALLVGSALTFVLSRRRSKK